MSYTIVYLVSSKLDVINAKNWYRNQQIGLDNRFATAIKCAILRLKENPFYFQLRYNNIRIAYPKTFPFGIHYYIDLAKREIIIVAIIHNKRNFIEEI